MRSQLLAVFPSKLSHRAGNYLNFDLAFPSIAIPGDFFPSNSSYYGYSDFGVWNATYEATPCSNWSGWNDPAALGSVTTLGDSVCCPADAVSDILYFRFDNRRITENFTVKCHLSFLFRATWGPCPAHGLSGCCSSTETKRHVYPYYIGCFPSDGNLNSSLIINECFPTISGSRRLGIINFSISSTCISGQ